MATLQCPHCDARLPYVRDAFCNNCGEPLDEPPPIPRTAEEKAAFAAQVHQDARSGLFATLQMFFLSCAGGGVDLWYRMWRTASKGPGGKGNADRDEPKSDTKSS